MKRKLTVLAIAASLATAATVAFAVPQYGYTVTYYSDATYTTIVGTGEFTCTGKWRLYSGVKTPYYLETEEIEC